ncbi:hypothetical protein EV696_11528 [Permianibacter aggregans]|uniref:Uncharacterized protein n=1 Tax=Permianibacter aggregans TaxID=1510150 RepID=A0A4R6URU2_9GAMM|nr:hypothetical protein EV696_11528 [Permianibacter aggregans]
MSDLMRLKREKFTKDLALGAIILVALNIRFPPTLRLIFVQS